MKKLLAVIDKCLFQEICEVESELEREGYWAELYKRYQLVVPFVLIEEVIANLAVPGKIPQQIIERMRCQLVFLKPCWMEDITETVFSELVENRPLRKMRAPSDEIVSSLLKMRSDDPHLIEWSEQRKNDRKETAQIRKAEQERLLKSATTGHMHSYREFFERTVKREFLHALDDPKQKHEMLEAILGVHFRQRHRAKTDQIEAAFAKYGPKTFSRYPVTLYYLTVRMAYLFAPAVNVKRDDTSQPRRILRGTASGQFNNVQDEQYLVSAFVCNRLLTRDSGMNTMAEVFREVGWWKGDPVFLDPEVDLNHQIPHLLR